MSSEEKKTSLQVADDSANDQKTFRAVYDEEEGFLLKFTIG